MGLLGQRHSPLRVLRRVGAVGRRAVNDERREGVPLVGAGCDYALPCGTADADGGHYVNFRNVGGNMGLEEVRAVVRDIVENEGGGCIADVAAAAGITRPTVSKWLSQTGRDPALTSLMGVMRAFPERRNTFMAALLAEDVNEGGDHETEGE